MSEDILVNGYSVVISVEHVTEPGEGWRGSRLVAECSNMEELSKVLNDPSNKPELYWMWKIDFQDKYLINV